MTITPSTLKDSSAPATSCPDQQLEGPPGLLSGRNPNKKDRTPAEWAFALEQAGDERAAIAHSCEKTGSTRRWLVACQAGRSTCKPKTVRMEQDASGMKCSRP